MDFEKMLQELAIIVRAVVKEELALAVNDIKKFIEKLSEVNIYGQLMKKALSTTNYIPKLFLTQKGLKKDMFILQMLS